MTIRPTLTALALAGTLATLPAAAQSSRAALLGQARAEFAASDINHDGVLTRAEAAARIAHMKMAGAAHPLSQQQARELTEVWFRTADTNHDGRVTLAEWETMTTTLFDRYDTNRDGIISPAERAAAKAQLRAEVPRR